MLTLLEELEAPAWLLSLPDDLVWHNAFVYEAVHCLRFRSSGIHPWIVKIQIMSPVKIKKTTSTTSF